MLLVVFVTADGTTIFCEVYGKYFDRMFYMAKSILGAERAEDAVQDAFEKLVKMFGENDYAELGEKPGLYFVILVRNISLNILKKEGRVKIMPLPDDEDEDVFTPLFASPEDTVLNAEALDKLISLIRQLKPDARQLIDYKYVAGYSNTEIAKELGVPTKLVDDRLYNAREQLKKMLSRKEPFSHD